jgi:phage shock protein A
MADLKDKLNTLVQSRLRVGSGRRSDDKPITPARLKKMDREIADFRRQIDAALTDEDRQIKQIDGVKQQIADWDRQADEALGRGDEINARQAVRQMQLQQQGLAMLEADLAQHRAATFALIQQVNELEGVVGAAHQQSTKVEVDDTPSEALSVKLMRDRAPMEVDDTPSEALSVRLLKARQQEPPASVNDASIDDDLARRRARLSQ